jgi:hypothetical protein
MVGHIAKPFEPEQIVDVVLRHARRRRHSPVPAP